MNTKELAEKLNNCEYRNEVSKELEAHAKERGIVIVFGCSDDLMEFRGAIDDELDAYDGTTACLDSNGLCTNNCQEEDCPYFAKIKERAKRIKAIWHDDGTWTYQTDIPHEAFDVVENGEFYCRGIVFYLDDAK